MFSIGNVKKEKYFRYGCLMTVLSIISQSLIHNAHVFYFINTLSFICFLLCCDFSRRKNEDKVYRNTCLCIILYNIVLLVRLVLHPEGQSWGTYLFHPNFIQSLLVFLLLYIDYDLFPVIIKYMKKLYVVALLLLPLSFTAGVRLLSIYIFFAFIFYEPFFRKQRLNYRVWIIAIAAMVVFVSAVLMGNRFLLLFLFLLGVSFFVVTFFPRWNKRLWIGYMTLPVIFFICFYVYDISLFDVSNWDMSVSEEDEMYADTRSFLFEEIVASLSYDDCLFIGEGLNGRIMTALSSEIDATIDEDGRRQFMEANYLDLMRRGGIIYLLLYFTLISYSSYKAFKSNSRTMVYVAFFLAASLVGSLIDLVHKMNYNTIIILMCVVMSASDKLRRMNDKEINLWVTSKVKKNKI